MSCKINSLVAETVASFEKTANIQEAASFMAKNNLGSILVTESGKVIGLFTERDLLTRVIGADKDPRECTLGDVCTHNLISVSHNSTCKEAIRLMQTHNCRRLLVYRQDSLHGLVNISDVAHALAEHRRFKNLAVNLVGGMTLIVVLAVITMLIAILPHMLDIAVQSME